MFDFHVLVHGQSESGPQALATTFDSAYAALAELPRLFIEPDGSFVWTGTDGNGVPWQVDGNLLDQGPSLAYVELKGRCSKERIESLLQALGWPEQTMLFQLPAAGLLLTEEEFWKLGDQDAP